MNETPHHFLEIEPRSGLWASASDRGAFRVRL
jgi:hypothetical protein